MDNIAVRQDREVLLALLKKGGYFGYTMRQIEAHLLWNQLRTQDALCAIPWSVLGHRQEKEKGRKICTIYYLKEFSLCPDGQRSR